MKRIIIILFVIGVIYASTGVSIAQSPARGINEYSPQEMIEYYAKQYGSSSTQLEKVMQCESNGVQNIWGDKNHAYGVYQYWQGTWDTFSKEFGEKLDRNSEQDQIKLTAWAFSKGLQTHWTCSYLTGILK